MPLSNNERQESEAILALSSRFNDISTSPVFNVCETSPPADFADDLLPLDDITSFFNELCREVGPSTIDDIYDQIIQENEAIATLPKDSYREREILERPFAPAFSTVNTLAPAAAMGPHHNIAQQPSSSASFIDTTTASLPEAPATSHSHIPAATAPHTTRPPPPRYVQQPERLLTTAPVIIASAGPSQSTCTANNTVNNCNATPTTRIGSASVCPCCTTGLTILRSKPIIEIILVCSKSNCMTAFRSIDCFLNHLAHSPCGRDLSYVEARMFCTKCAFSPRTIDSMNAHLLAHEKTVASEYAHICRICNLIFYSGASLFSSHFEIHRNSPFCNIPPGAFPRQSKVTAVRDLQLLARETKLTLVTEFFCYKCNLMFRDTSQLVRHHLHCVSKKYLTSRPN